MKDPAGGEVAAQLPLTYRLESFLYQALTIDLSEEPKSPVMTQKLTELVLGAVVSDSLTPYSGNVPDVLPPLEKLSGDVLEEVLEAMYSRGEPWSDSWRVFLTPRIRMLIVPWDVNLFKEIGKTCRSLEVLLVTSVDVTFSSECLSDLPRNLHTLDLDGELYFAGRTLPEVRKGGPWLADVDYWIRLLRTERLQPERFRGGCEGLPLTRLHLGRAAVSSEELVRVLGSAPNLTFLRHYQLVSALCRIHLDDWKAGRRLPVYSLTNIDADFSHVVRCRMSPKAVLPADALGLAVALCPRATSVRIRFDNSTSHHVVGHLLGLDRLEELSGVCVSSGERVLLDFQDFRPLLEHFGNRSLRHLEFKVVEEVDSHTILKHCPRLEGLTLSGCGFTQNCRGPRCRPGPSLPSLLYLFYADGDDFSWDHTLSQCFWLSAFGNSKKRGCKLEGLFLESPRMTEDTLNALFVGEEAEFGYLRSACLKRAPEFSAERLSQLAGVSPRLEYMRCEGLGQGAASSISRRRPGLKLKIE